MTTQMEQLRVSLCETFDGLRGGSINTDVARSLAYVAGKIINSCKVELEYAHLRQQKPRIAYLDAGAGIWPDDKN